MKPITILLVIDSIEQAGAYWRSTGPLSALKKSSNVPINYIWNKREHITWAEVASADIVFMHRPVDSNDRRIVQHCIDLGVKLWVDYDDNLFKVPEDNLTCEKYSDQKAIHNMLSFVFASDVCSTSTLQLKRWLDKYRAKKDTIVLPNGILKERFSYRDPFEERAEKKRVMWRGSMHHQRDLDHVRDDLVTLITKYEKEWEFWFVGHKPWYLTEACPNNVFSISPMPVMDYFKCLHSVRPDVCMVPLFDNEFNRCKSNIAAIEGVMAGAVPVVPDWEEWNVFGHRYDSSKNFTTVLESVMNLTPEFRQKCNVADWEVVSHEFDLGKINIDRDIIVKHLTNNPEMDPRMFEELVQENHIKAYGSLPVEKAVRSVPSEANP